MNSAVFLLTTVWLAGAVPVTPVPVAPPPAPVSIGGAPGIPVTPGPAGLAPGYPGFPGQPGFAGPQGAMPYYNSARDTAGVHPYPRGPLCPCWWLSLLPFHCCSCGCAGRLRWGPVVRLWRFGPIDAAPPLATQQPSCGQHGCTGASLEKPRQTMAARTDTQSLAVAVFNEKDSNTAAGQAARGKLVVALPAGSRLYVDGQLMEVRGRESAFRTPPLDAREEYSYELRAERDYQGQVVTRIHAGCRASRERSMGVVPTTGHPPGSEPAWSNGL